MNDYKTATTTAILTELDKINDSHQPLVRGGAVLANQIKYLSGHPYLFTTDINRAFRFRDADQAQRFAANFPEFLGDFTAVSLEKP